MNSRTRTVATAPKADVDTSQIDMGSLDKSIDLTADISIEELRDQLNAGASDVGSPHFKDFAETMAFMEEKVLIRVLPSSEPHAEKIIEVWNDGVPQRFIRDEWVVAKRKFAEVLARAKPFSVTTPESLDARGDKTRRIDIHNGQRYPFEMKDKNPKGSAWLNAIYMER